MPHITKTPKKHYMRCMASGSTVGARMTAAQAKGAAHMPNTEGTGWAPRQRFAADQATMRAAASPPNPPLQLDPSP